MSDKFTAVNASIRHFIDAHYTCVKYNYISFILCRKPQVPWFYCTFLITLVNFLTLISTNTNSLILRKSLFSFRFWLSTSSDLVVCLFFQHMLNTQNPNFIDFKNIDERILRNNDVFLNEKLKSVLFFLYHSSPCCIALLTLFPYFPNRSPTRKEE